MKRALAVVLVAGVMVAGCSEPPVRSDNPITQPSLSAAECSKPMMRESPTPITLPAKPNVVSVEPLPNLVDLNKKFNSTHAPPAMYVHAALLLIEHEGCIINITDKPAGGCTQPNPEQSVWYCKEPNQLAFNTSSMNEAFRDRQFGSLELFWQMVSAAGEHKQMLGGNRDCADAMAMASLVAGKYLTLEQIGSLSRTRGRSYLWPNAGDTDAAARTAMLQSALSKGVCS